MIRAVDILVLVWIKAFALKGPGALVRSLRRSFSDGKVLI